MFAITFFIVTIISYLLHLATGCSKKKANKLPPGANTTHAPPIGTTVSDRSNDLTSAKKSIDNITPVAKKLEEPAKKPEEEVKKPEEEAKKPEEAPVTKPEQSAKNEKSAKQKSERSKKSENKTEKTRQSDKKTEKSKKSAADKGEKKEENKEENKEEKPSEKPSDKPAEDKEEKKKEKPLSAEKQFEEQDTQPSEDCPAEKKAQTEKTQGDPTQVDKTQADKTSKGDKSSAADKSSKKEKTETLHGPEKSHVKLDPESLEFQAGEMEVKELKMTNIHDQKVKFKVKTSDNVVYQVHPVYGVLEPGQTIQMAITHQKSAAKEDKLVIVNSVSAGEGKDLAVSFKTAKPTGKPFTVKMVGKIHSRTPGSFPCDNKSSNKACDKVHVNPWSESFFHHVFSAPPPPPPHFACCYTNKDYQGQTETESEKQSWKS
uniref:Major sperm protein n=2 Tax=Caenorhabditis japonica TaxID=281687 RepID=A0A8R1DUT6_CAEJA